ncbi:MAG: citrate/2-methylcitrate synthase [Burkholderiaceae bacterium]
MRAEVMARTGEAPNIDFALTAMTDALGLPNEAPLMVFTIGRLAGWVAHALSRPRPVH